MSTLNQKTIQYAQAHLNQRVYADIKGALGECWDLAYMALKTAGAKTPHDYGSNVYRWSSKVVSLSAARAGDIIQYQSYRFKVRTEHPDGSWKEMTYSIGEPNHTAILKEKKGDGKISVYEQNMDGNMSTHINTYRLVVGTYTSGNRKIIVSKLGGSYKIYRPLKKRQETSLMTPDSHAALHYASIIATEKVFIPQVFG